MNLTFDVAKIRFPHVAVFLLAIIVHLVIIGGAFWEEAYPEDTADEARYIFYAESIRDGAGMHAPGLPDQPTAYVMPNLPLFFAAIGPGTAEEPNFIRLRLAQLMLSGLVAVLTFDIGRRLLDSQLGGWLSVAFLLARLGWAQQPYLLLTEPLFIFFLLVAVWGLIQQPEKPRYLLLIAIGLGLAWLTRGAIFFGMIFVFLYLWWRVGFVRTFATGVLMLAIIAPWGIRNYGAFDAFVITSTQSGNVLGGAYNDVIYEDPWLNGWVDPNELYNQEVSPDILNDEIAYSDYFVDRGVEWIQSNPEKLPKLMAAHFFGFVRPWGTHARNTIELAWELMTWFVGGMLVLYGWYVAYQEKREKIGAISLLILGAFVTGMIFFMIPRYRLPYMPLFSIIAALGAMRLWALVQVKTAAQ